jgi:hypothetical protein
MTPKEAVVYIERKILERDELNLLVAKEFGRKPPSWTGNDSSDLASVD